jgi:tRNA(fMet)-specific endonuclease VapC
MRYLLDSNAVIALLNDVSSQTARRARAVKPGDISISDIVAHELFYGAFKEPTGEPECRPHRRASNRCARI